MKLGYLVGVALACIPVVRREIRDLSLQELGKLTSAINQLHKQGEYELFTRIHLCNVEFAHNVPAFLPWHRYFIRKFEMALQEIDPSVSLPYWDWSLDSQAPHLSKVLTPSLYGGNGKKDNCVQDGPFANWQMTIPNRHCLRRDFDRGTRIQPFSYPEEINLFLNDPSFSIFSRLLEERHFYPHLFIGGAKGDLKPMWSPNDPLFFLHHCFLDLLWTKWQHKHQHAIQYDGNRYRINASLSDTLTPWKNVTVQSTLDTKHPFYCYTYPNYPLTFQPQQQEFEESLATNPFFNGFLENATFATAPDLLRAKIDIIIKTTPNPRSKTPITPTGPFTDKWITSIGLNLTEFRASTDASILLSQLINQLPGFESLSTVVS
ncbi:hypothetical protein DSO57_1000659 [Entomophthora muscae]|uniref:Uncharacterized protein n=1 Tax=Entomophthora muscae TaxID=34485 RepID=A0ACC2TWK4_9FUNG|nr:hypothetical protein DSO57_1000659 [Entomophthora muscae]